MLDFCLCTLNWHAYIQHTYVVVMRYMVSSTCTATVQMVVELALEKDEVRRKTE